MKSYKQFKILLESSASVIKNLSIIKNNNDLISGLRADANKDVEKLKKEIDQTMEEMKKDPAMQAGNNEPKSEEYNKTLDELQKRIDKIKASYDVKISNIDKKSDSIKGEILKDFLKEYIDYFKTSFNYETVNNPDKYKRSILDSIKIYHKKSAYVNIDFKFDDELFDKFVSELKNT
jgi:hypothetical protein